MAYKNKTTRELWYNDYKKLLKVKTKVNYQEKLSNDLEKFEKRLGITKQIRQQEIEDKKIQRRKWSKDWYAKNKKKHGY